MSIRLEEQRPTWAEIDLRAFDRNIDALASRLPDGTRLIALLKADAYGHGAVELARRCTPDRVAMIGVALLEEALELRRAGVTLPLLVLGALSETQVRIALEHDVTLGVPGPESLEAVAAVARDRRDRLQRLGTGHAERHVMVQSEAHLRLVQRAEHQQRQGDARPS